MPAIIATIRVKPGMGAQFEPVAKELVAMVNANEPGCLLYVLLRGDEPDSYVMMERYADEAAIELHRKTDYFKEIGKRMGAFMAGPPEVRVLAEV